MKTVVITGSARGLGLEMAKVFKEKNVNVILSDLNEENFVFVLHARKRAKEDKKISLIYIIFNNYNSRAWGNCGKPEKWVDLTF